MEISLPLNCSEVDLNPTYIADRLKLLQGGGAGEGELKDVKTCKIEVLVFIKILSSIPQQLKVRRLCLFSSKGNSTNNIPSFSKYLYSLSTVHM